MGGQQYQEPSAYARVDYVDGEIKKHLRTCSNITDIRTILEKASEEYTKLNERVVGLEAVVKSLQEIIKGAINHSFTESSQTPLKIEKKMNLIKSSEVQKRFVLECPDDYIKSGDVNDAFRVAGYCRPILKSNGTPSYYYPTMEGINSGLVARHVSGYTVFNADRWSEIKEIIKRYIKRRAEWEKKMGEE